MKNRSNAIMHVTIQTVRDNVYQIVRDGVLLQVVLDKDLADYYGVEIRALNQQVNRSLKGGRSLFDGEVHDLTKDEWAAIKKSRSQSVILGKDNRNQQHTGGNRPKVYTAKGAIAVSKVVNSDRADEVYKVLVDAFIYQQSVKIGNAEVSAERFDALEKRVDKLELKEHIPSIQQQITTNNIFNAPAVYVAGDLNGDIKQELESQISLALIQLKNEVSKSQLSEASKDELKKELTQMIVDTQKSSKSSFADRLAVLANAATIYGALPTSVIQGMKVVLELGKKYLGL